jgi:ketosteroid isomerase-like protein
MTHPNETLVRDGIAAFSRGDLDALRTQYFAEDIRWHFPGQSVVGGDYEGVDRVIEMFGKLAELSGGTHRVELHDVIANDDHAVALHATRGERAGKGLEINAVQIFHIRDGKISEAWTMHSDLYAVDEFWS